MTDILVHIEIKEKPLTKSEISIEISENVILECIQDILKERKGKTILTDF